MFFLLSLPFISVFSDPGTIAVVSGKSFQINYDAKYVQVLGVQPSKEDQGLIFSIESTNPISILELTLPRELIDATKKDGNDDNFIVLVDGTFTTYVEKNPSQTSRTITVQLAPENKELEIIGTHITSSDNGSTGTTQTPIPPNPVPEQTQNTQSQQNQTIKKPIENPSEKPSVNESPQNLPTQEILSKIFHFDMLNPSFNFAGKQIIEYSVIGSAILILIVVITSSKKSKIRKQAGK